MFGSFVGFVDRMARNSHEPFKRSIAKTPKSCVFRPVMSVSQKLFGRPHGSLDLGFCSNGPRATLWPREIRIGQHDTADCPGAW